MSSSSVHSWCLVAVLAGSVACARPYTQAALAFRQPAASVSAQEPSRPRFIFAPTDPGARLRASRISVRLTDARQVPIAASTLPALARAGASRSAVEIHPASEARATERLALLLDGKGPVLSVEGNVTELDVLENDDQDMRLISASVDWVLRDAAGWVLHAGRTRGGYELAGAPHDRAELDELHVGALLGALDHFLAKPEAVELVNLGLASQSVAVPHTNQR
jgi:hypothetical protein